jgi:hypothetical protein
MICVDRSLNPEAPKQESLCQSVHNPHPTLSRILTTLHTATFGYVLSDARFFHSDAETTEIYMNSHLYGIVVHVQYMPVRT